MKSRLKRESASTVGIWIRQQGGCIPGREDVLQIVQQRLHEHYLFPSVVSPCMAQLPMVNCAAKHLVGSFTNYHRLAHSALKPTVAGP